MRGFRSAFLLVWEASECGFYYYLAERWTVLIAPMRRAGRAGGLRRLAVILCGYRSAEERATMPRNHDETASEPPVSVRVTRPFLVRGRVVVPGEVVELAAEDASDLIARERAEPAVAVQ